MSLNRASIPIIGAAIHVAVCVAIALNVFGSEGSWKWFLAFLIDFPASILFLPLQGIVPNLIVFGILGSLWWFGILWVVMKIFGALRRKGQDQKAI